MFGPTRYQPSVVNMNTKQQKKNDFISFHFLFLLVGFTFVIRRISNLLVKYHIPKVYILIGLAIPLLLWRLFDSLTHAFWYYFFVCCSCCCFFRLAQTVFSSFWIYMKFIILCLQWRIQHDCTMTKRNRENLHIISFRSHRNSFKTIWIFNEHSTIQSKKFDE